MNFSLLLRQRRIKVFLMNIFLRRSKDFLLSVHYILSVPFIFYAFLSCIPIMCSYCILLLSLFFFIFSFKNSSWGGWRDGTILVRLYNPFMCRVQCMIYTGWDKEFCCEAVYVSSKERSSRWWCRPYAWPPETQSGCLF